MKKVFMILGGLFILLVIAIIGIVAIVLVLRKSELRTISKDEMLEPLHDSVFL